MIKLDTNITHELFVEGSLNEFEHLLSRALKEHGVVQNSISIPREIIYSTLKEARDVSKKDAEKYRKLNYFVA